MLDEILARLSKNLTPQQFEQLEQEVNEILPDEVWYPNAGPQTEAYLSKADILLYGGQPGGGKDLELSTLVATPTGFTPIGDLNVGDSVIDIDGNETKIIAVSEVFTKNKCFEISFNSGEKFIAGEGHLWLTLTDKERKNILSFTPEWRERKRKKRPSRALKEPQRPWAQQSITISNQNRVYQYKNPVLIGNIRTTKELSETQKRQDGGLNHSIKTCEPLNLATKDLLVDPYLLGLWLGDGFSNSGRIGMMESDLDLIKINSEIVSEKVKREEGKKPFKQICFKNLHKNLRAIGLLGNKRIPRNYLRASIEQRKELLRGLMDTDGTCDKRGQLTISLSKRDLLEDVFELVSSLGIKATIHTRFLNKKNPNHNDSHAIKFMADFEVFKLPRKLERQKLSGLRPCVKRRFITEIREVESVATKCIEVDCPTKTYLIGKSLIPTHNSALLLGCALTQHQRSLVIRKQFTDLEAIVDGLQGILKTSDGIVRGNRPKYKSPEGKIISFQGMGTSGDLDTGKQGNAFDFIGVDEAAQLPENDIRLMIGWNRTTAKNQRCRIILASNPPVNSIGDWLGTFFGAWLDPKHPNPAKFGELRWFIFNSEGKSQETVDKNVVTIDGVDYYPHSRTYIPARLEDNPYLNPADYKKNLQTIPEPFRSQLLSGNFLAAREDQHNQVIPTSWVQAAIARHEKRTCPPEGIPMCNIGLDCSAGGKDFACLVTRYDHYFGKIVKFKTTQNDAGEEMLAELIKNRRDRSHITIDMGGGYGGSVWKMLKDSIGTEMMVAFRGGETPSRRSSDGKLTFTNARSQAYWELREALDPEQDNGSHVELPNDARMLAGLTAPTFEIRGVKIQVEPKEEVKKKLGYSPDEADAIVMAWWGGRKGLIPETMPKFNFNHVRPTTMKDKYTERRGL